MSDEQNQTERPEIDFNYIDEAIQEEGEWLEGQVSTELGVYASCPVCKRQQEGLAVLLKNMEEIAEFLSENEDKFSPEAIEAIWLVYNHGYLTAKEFNLQIFKLAHEPHRVMKAHPELAITKGQRRQITSGKNRRKMARESRRKNR